MRRFIRLLSIAALCAPLAAAALDGSVTLYGTVMPFVDNARTSGATAAGLSPANGGATQVGAAAYTGVVVPQRFRVTSGTTNIGFKGGVDLAGEDLQVFFQVESAVSPDGDAPNAWASRNSALGLKGKFGRVLVGNWDTPYKFPILLVGAVRGLDPFDNALTANPGFGVPGTTTQSGRAGAKADAAFNRRQGNSVQYWTPELYGFSARLAVSVNETRSAATATASSASPTLYSGLVSWQRGPVTVRYAYERHVDYFGLSQLGGSAGATLTNTGSTDQGHELIGQVQLPTDTRLSLILERLTYENDDQAAGAVRSYARNAWYGLVQQRFGPHQVFASFGHAAAGTCKVVGGGACTTNGLGASQASVGYTYSIGKSFDVYASWYQTVNGRSATYGVVGGPGAVTPGADTRGLGVGFLYTFAATAGAGAPAGI